MKIPIRDTDDNSSEHNWWASISWDELYDHLSRECTFAGRINEMELVPNAQTFINRLNTHGNILIELGKGFMNYIIDNYNQHYPV